MNHTAFRPTQIYQHDGPSLFRFEIRGSLAGNSVRELEYAWISVRSTTLGQAMVVDLSAASKIDANGFSLLCRMRESGVRLRADGLSESFELESLLDDVAHPAVSTQTGQLRVPPVFRRCSGHWSVGFAPRWTGLSARLALILPRVRSCRPQCWSRAIERDTRCTHHCLTG